MKQRVLARKEPRPRAGLGGVALAVGGAVFSSFAAQAQENEIIAVPSGQVVTYLDMISSAPDSGEAVVRFRFVAPAIARDGGAVSAEEAQQDMEFLCRSFVLPRLSKEKAAPEQVIISFADRELPFGEPSPDATQFFEAYRIENGACVWEAF